MTGYAELDAYGNWDTASGYGEIWYPNVPAGWAPYTQGRWVWVEPWGWTWVDDAPWGFAPSHYGRWAFIGDRWCWVPGSFEPSPVYAPALVGFLGGPGFGLYVSGAIGPQVGWFPLAPGEIYWPSSRADPSYVRALNRANVANIDSIRFLRNGRLPAQVTNGQFANRRFATVVPEHVFAGGGKVDPATLHVPAAVLEHATVTMRSPRIGPVRAQPVPGPAGGRIAGSSAGYGSTVAPAPGALRGGHDPGVAAQAPVAQGLAAQGMPAARSGGRWPGATPEAPHSAAPAPRIRAAHPYSPPTSHAQAAYRAPPHLARAAPQIAHLPGGGGHGPAGGGLGHVPGGGGHAASAGHGGGSGNHAGGGHGGEHHG